MSKQTESDGSFSDARQFIDSCDNCGACCRGQESPPGYLLLLHFEPDLDRLDDPDVVRLREMPGEARREIEDYIERLRRGEMPYHAIWPACLWYDPNRRSCRWHEWRPEICRDFAVGSQECREWRQEYRIGPLEKKGFSNQ